MEQTICFIIPSIGRNNLSRALQSLQAQTDTSWEAIVVFDGMEHQPPNGFQDDLRINFINSPKKKSAGLTRNFAMHNLKHDWYAFLDDDDKVRKDYIEKLREEINRFPKTKTVIWRINYNKDIVPDAGSNDFRIGRVGIAFAIHRSVYHYYGIYFKNQYAEDFDMLDRIRKRGLPMVISPYVVYSVREVDFNFKRHNYEEIEQNRAIINQDVVPGNLSL